MTEHFNLDYEYFNELIAWPYEASKSYKVPIKKK